MINTCLARLSSATLILLCSLTALADTTTVQTYTFEAQNNPATAYDSPGRRWFEFPTSDNGVEYGKVIMEYTLKCFEDGTQLRLACGEWDYLSYTWLTTRACWTAPPAAPFYSSPMRRSSGRPVPYVDGVQIRLPAAHTSWTWSPTASSWTVDYADDLFAPAFPRAQFL